MSRLLLIDGNSIMNRAFYGIMGSKMLTTPDGTYTNAIYGFLSILFKELEELKPEYIGIAFDLKAPTARHKMYEGYKANRHGMPDELAQQMPIIKQILRQMNIQIIEKEGYEADDVLGTLAKRGEKDGLEVTILSGDRDTFQLTSDKITVRIPRTKMGKTEEDDFNREKVFEIYGVEPIQMIEVKGLMGDTSDNIPGVPGIGEKTALGLIKDFGTIENLYAKLEENPDCVKGKLKEKLVENKELAFLSKTLGTINLQVPIEETLEDFTRKEWEKEEVYQTFQELRFQRFIDRFELQGEGKAQDLKELFTFTFLTDKGEIEKLKEKIKKQKNLTYYFTKTSSNDSDKIINKTITMLSVYEKEENTVYQISRKQEELEGWKEILEDETIVKNSYEMVEDIVLLQEEKIDLKGIAFDLEVAAYDLNPSAGKYKLDSLAEEYLNLRLAEYSKEETKEEQSQMTLFDVPTNEKEDNWQDASYCYVIGKAKEILLQKLEQDGMKQLFEEIEMPLVKVLAQMQSSGMKVDKETLNRFGQELKKRIEELTKEIYELAGEEFNINSTQQLRKNSF